MTALNAIAEREGRAEPIGVSPRPVFELKPLLGSIAWLLLALGVAVASIGWTLTQRQQAGQALQVALKERGAVQNRLVRVSDEAREIGEKIVRYREILDRGLTQPEQRLLWMEQLQAIKTTRRLLALTYEIAPQQRVESRGGHDFLVSRMTLDLSLLHENDLLGLLDDLRAQAQVLVSVDSCRIERAPQGAHPAAQLQAHCAIDWIKLQEQR